MKPESKDFHDKAMRKLQRAQRMIKLDLPEDAARTAYIACFHLAQAVVFERSGKIAKTHKGVHAAFYLQTSEDTAVDKDLRSFLARSYRYKYADDYAVGIEEETTLSTATRAVDIASSFFAHFTKLLE